jgi:RNA polymerase sigma factor (sigma-70 family)
MQQQDEYELRNRPDDAALYDLYERAIFAYVRLHTASREDAEDVTLEVFTAALENDNLSALQDSERLAWLRRVAYHKLVDGYRRSLHNPGIPLDQVVDAILDDEAKTPEHIATQREAYEQLHATIRTLPIVQQQVLKLRYGDELRFAEIATLLNKREEAVRKMLSRTLALLRTIYQKQREGGERTC